MSACRVDKFRLSFISPGLQPDKRSPLSPTGTFHSTCVRYLRRHATLVGLAHNFVVQDTDDGKRVIKNILRDRVAEMLEGDLKMTEKTAQEAISKAKCKSISPEDMHASAVKTGDSVNLFLAVVSWNLWQWFRQEQTG